MISIVLVSHSQTLAQGVLQLTRQMVQDRVPIALAAGTDNPDEPIGTDPMKVVEAIQSVYSEEGVLILMDLGSALMSAETAIEFLDPEQQQHVYLCEAPFVEGGLAAAVAASGGGDMDFVINEARAALAHKTSQLITVLRIPPRMQPAPSTDSLQPDSLQPDSLQNALATESAQLESQQIEPQQETERQQSADLTITVHNRFGLHARPAAMLINVLAPFSVHVQVEHKGRTINARSLNMLLTLGARQGDTLLFRFAGTDALAARQAVQTLAANHFSDRADRFEVNDLSTPGLVAPPTPHKDQTHGVAAAPGIAVGPVYLFDQQIPVVPADPAADIETAWENLSQALRAVRSDLAALEQETAYTISADAAAIFQAQQLMLNDPELLAHARGILDATGLNAAAVWQRAVAETVKRYETLADTYLRQRAADLEDVGRRVLQSLCGASATSLMMDRPSILIATDLHASDMAQLRADQILGLLLKRGGATSHSAILARALGIPTVVGLGTGLDQLTNGQTVGLDGTTGQVWLAPTEAEIESLQSQLATWRTEQQRLLKRLQTPTHTQDGKRIEIAANIVSSTEARRAATLGAESVGLFRTEFLFMQQDMPPSEEAQFTAYCAAARALNGAPVTIRTLDVGGDKHIAYLPQQLEDNPFLGLRGIRFCLAQPALFKTQLRALLRASAQHNIRIMLPMISALHEVKEARALLQEAQRELNDAAIPYNDSLEFGIMIETPAAVWAAHTLAQEVDFFSIGSNDLTQYVMAADRGNASVAAMATPFQPAVLRAMQQVVQAAHDAGIWVAICGVVAGNPLATPLLVGLGLDELSMSAPLIPRVKEVVQGLALTEAEALASQALACRTPEEVEHLLQQASSKS